MSFTIQERPTAQQLVDAFVNPGSGVTTENLSITGNAQCVALYSGASSVVTDPTINFPDTGLIIGTGLPSSLYNQDGTESYYDFGTPGDLDILALGGDITITSHDACILQFDFSCNNIAGGWARMDYVFSSDEYREQVTEGNGFADVFGLLLNGENIATVPGTNDPVGVYTINHIQESEYFVFNDPRPGQGLYPGFEPDGFTVGLQAEGYIQPGLNTMKIGIVDVNDAFFDSWLFLKQGSFRCIEDPLATWPPTAAPTPAPTNLDADTADPNCQGSACGGEHFFNRLSVV